MTPDELEKEASITDLYGAWICAGCGKAWESERHQCK